MSEVGEAKKKFSLTSILTIRKKPKEIVEKEEKKLTIERVMPVEEPLRIVERDPSWRVLESYYVYKPFVKITIAETPTGPMYFVEEQGLTPDDKSILSKLAEILMDEIHPPSKPEDVRDLRAYVFKEVERIAEKYRDKLGLVGARRIKVFYYVERNLLGYGAIDPFLRDPNIEDLSCNGVNVPIFVWHRRYESIPTNVSFMDEEYLNELIMKLAHMAGKHISIAYPVLDAMLPEKHRVAATYGHEVSVKGPSFTIRKFREKPFSVIELIEQGNIDSLTSAYIWLLLEHGKTFMVAGGTGTGKTTLLNALSMFIKPGMKIVTIEDTPELNLPHVNWVQLTSREVYIAGAQSLGTSVKLYDLVKLSLRYRPDYIIVGEVRGDEAFVLFQAMATGHSGASTIHAETLDYAVKRLTSPPMNIPPTYMRLMNVFMHVQRVITRVEKGVVKVRRRITVVQEVEDFEKYIKISTWDPRTDSHVVNLERSIHLQDIALKRGFDVSDLIEEIKRRSTVLEWMLVKGIKDAWDVSRIIFDYYYEPKAVYEKARSELGELLKKESVESPAE
ncbi:type II/IV secretion system ATPase subunit [Thermosphaera aggregans]|jgi:flagellar protein FlaI|uniref:Type II secretion system protein E n=1 Tax=Thermosphaera aggregans (strain DSM 11486 / M11TL) TaxID=633148 RepID=D5U0J9_THEAM|nr:type II/IV secretion system ATPase subunit [Thermosphaera aggregans]ADG90649.1 type II secretion system protein E [Thermosphaera aggregans DSM 11486]